MLTRTLSDGFAVECWNPSGRINDQQVQDEILSTEPDIAIFPEAACEDEGIRINTTKRFRAAGYKVLRTSYNDDDARNDRHLLAAIVRPEFVAGTIFVESEYVAGASCVRLAGRTTLLVRLQGGVDLMPLQLDSVEGLRRALQARHAIRRLGSTAVVVGNAIVPRSETPRVGPLRRAASLARHVLSSIELGIGNLSGLRPLGGPAQQTTRFTAGTTMPAFLEAGFEDASEDHEPPMQEGLLGTPDGKILYRGHIEVLEPTRFDKAGGLSDHWRARAVLAHIVRY